LTRAPTTGSTYYDADIENTSDSWVTPGTGLDGNFPYGFSDVTNAAGDITGDLDGSDPLTPGATYTWTAGTIGGSGDGPGGTLAAVDVDSGGDSWSESSYSDNFTTWMMYEPPSNGVGTVWVPLQCATWSCDGLAEGGPDSWYGCGGDYTPPTPANTTVFPEWSEVVGPRTYEPGSVGP